MNFKSLLWASVSAVVGLAGVAPAHAQTAAASAAGAQDAPKPDAASDQSVNPTAPAPAQQVTPADENSEIVVTGLRRSLESAQAIKKNSDGIVDAIVAEDIGKLPDTFASSALQRVSGVTVTRGGGEAAGVTVRGLPDLSTTYNGREIFTAEGRFVAIQDFPAGTVAALEVYKSGTANLIEGGIGGQVNVRGRKPFDFQGFELSGSANAVYFEQAKKFAPNGNLLISDRWDTGIGEMGLLLNVAYVGIDFLDATREQSLVVQTGNATVAPGTTTPFRYPDAQARFTGYGHRWRPSANAAFQWKPTPELEIYADGLFQGFRSRDENRFMFVPIFGGTDFRLTDVTFRPDNPNLAQSATVSGANRPDGFYASVKGKTDTYQGGGGAIWQRDKLKVSGDIAYTNSKFTLKSVNIDYAFASSPTRTVNFDVPGSDGGPSFDFGSFDITNPANFISRGFFQEYLVVSGKDIQTRGDIEYDVSDTGLLRRIQVGVRYNDRDAARDRGAPYIPNEDARIPISDLPVDIALSRPGFTFSDAFTERRFAAIPAGSVFDNLAALRSRYGAPEGLPAFAPNETFRANEKALALYGQVKYGFDLGSVAVDGLVGLRAVRTRTSISGTTQIDTGSGLTFTPLEASNKYWDYLPNVSARVGFTDKLQLRAAYTQTRTRPGYLQLNPALVVSTPVQDDGDGNPNTGPRRGITQGNPNLTPLNSNNYDLSLEWYFSRTGSLTGAVFRRDARGFIYNVSRNLDSFPGVDTGGAGVVFNQVLNTGDTRLQGAEVAFSSFLDIDGLPDWAKGFGIQANGTYIDGKGDLPPDFAATINNEQRSFNGVSKWTYNLVGLYEKAQFSARLAYNYRSKFVQFYSLEALDPVVHGTIERGRGQLDFSTSVTPVPNITIAFDIANLLGNPLRRYRQFDEASGATYPRQILYIERSYSLGIRFRF